MCLDVPKRKRRRRKPGSASATSTEPTTTTTETKPEKESNSLQSRLDGSRFRFINEQLYTKHSKEAVQMFQMDPAAFELYHRGYDSQVTKWPTNPLDAVIAELGRSPPGTVVADVGCGKARLAEELGKRLTVHSFDLVAANEGVQVADMAHLPMEKHSVDVAVYCLSLMGTNIGKFMREAHRLLKTG